jgi:hypothetical protein
MYFFKNKYTSFIYRGKFSQKFFQKFFVNMLQRGLTPLFTCQNVINGEDTVEGRGEPPLYGIDIPRAIVDRGRKELSTVGPQ